MKHKKSEIWKKYKVVEGKIVREGRFCPRCGDGIFMAIHKEKDRTRYFCGKCKLTIWE